MHVRYPTLEQITTDVYLYYHRNDYVTYRKDYLLRPQFAECRVHQDNSNIIALCNLKTLNLENTGSVEHHRLINSSYVCTCILCRLLSILSFRNRMAAILNNAVVQWQKLRTLD